MLKLLLFLRRIHYVLLFIALEIVACSVFLRSNTYQKSRIVGASNRLVSSIYGRVGDVGAYFGLRTENERLLSENARLHSQLESRRYADILLGQTNTIAPETLQYYEYWPARVVNNNVSHRENYLTINRGSRDGIEPEMAILNDQGILGYVLHCSDHYSVCVSILNTKSFRTSGYIQGSDFAGSIYWDGRNSQEVILDEVPKYAEMAAGDTILTTHYSYIFPPDQPVGTIQSFEMINGTFYKVRVKLFVDMARLKNVYVVRYLEQQERRLLEETVNNQEVPGGSLRHDGDNQAINSREEGGQP